MLFVVPYCLAICLLFFFFKQKTAYEMRISDWSSDVCSSDLQLGQALEELRVFVADAVGPGVVVAQQFFECLFHGISPVGWRSAFGGRASATARRSTPQGVRR